MFDPKPPLGIDKELFDRLLEGRSRGNLFGKASILEKLTNALAERALRKEMGDNINQEPTAEAANAQSLPANWHNRSSQKPMTTDSSSSL